MSKKVAKKPQQEPAKLGPNVSEGCMNTYPEQCVLSTRPYVYGLIHIFLIP